MYDLTAFWEVNTDKPNDDVISVLRCAPGPEMRFLHSDRLKSASNSETDDAGGKH